MPIAKLDAWKVKMLPTVDGRRTEYSDLLLPGFVLRVSPGGARTFAVRYYFEGKGRRYTLGDASRISLGDARNQARQVLARAEIGDDPQTQKVNARRRREGAPSFGDLAERFLRVNETRLRPNTRRQWTGIVHREIRPALGNCAPEAITRGQVRDFVRKIAEDRPYMANRTFELVRRIFTWAVGDDLVPASPCVGLRKPGTEKARERTLSSEEVKSVWSALEAESGVGDAVRLGFYTGARVSEVLGLPWTEIDLAARLWTVAPARSKNGEPHPIPLSSAAAHILERRREGDQQIHVFSSPRPDVGGLRSIQRCMERIRTRSNVAFRFHDIRRTVATGLASLGTPDYVVEAVLGHAPARLKRTYNRYQPVREMRAALESWATYLAGVTGNARSQPAGMISLARR